MKYLVLDCETTGLLQFDKPADDPCQPRMIQLAAYLFEHDEGDLRDCGGFVKAIRPDGWTMPADLAAKLGHGLTHEHLMEHGQPVRDALEAFGLLHDRADFMVAYGIGFDLKIMRGELRRAGLDDRYGSKPDFCVMRACTPLCKMPPTAAMMASGRKTHKTPKLAEAVKIMLGEDLQNAHDARADCLATARLLHHLIGLGKGPVAGTAPKVKRTPPAPAPAGDESAMF